MEKEEKQEKMPKHTIQYKWRVIITTICWLFGLKYLNLFMFDGASFIHLFCGIGILALGYFYFGRLVTEKEKEIDKLLKQEENEIN